MVFFESLQALLSLDLQFFIDLGLSQIFWSFAFFATIYYFFNGKYVLYYFTIFVFYLWIFLDIGAISGLGLGSVGLGLWLIFRIFIEGLAKANGFVKNNFIFIWIPISYTLLLIMTLLW